MEEAAGRGASDEGGTPRRRADARRNLEAIVDAAAALLAEHPRASMREIAEAAGVHRATVHRHFASRDDLAEAVRARAFDATAGVVDTALRDEQAPAGPALSKLAEGLLGVGCTFRLDRFLVWHEPSFDTRARVLRERITGAVTRGQAEATVRTDLPAAQLAVMFGGLVWGLLPEVSDGAMGVGEAAAAIMVVLGAGA